MVLELNGSIYFFAIFTSWSFLKLNKNCLSLGYQSKEKERERKREKERYDFEIQISTAKTFFRFICYALLLRGSMVGIKYMHAKK